ncbi:hypothetical protein FH972_017773 [Carpinus fangiana]|uniref:Peptidase A1 domain-containing protein n=1 Tax=Carpinus fangiana TaxID=176857 RepID=A0A5N6RNU5_9ROSI|nr:hypothetical protein FH972_017773 [Carpinus fangiana]
MIEWRPISLLVIFFLSVGFDFHGFLFTHANPIRLELIHRDNPLLIGQLPRPKQTQLERFKELVRNDITRHRIISYKRGQWGASGRRNDLELEASIEMPMHSGADFGTGQYFVEVKVGKPAQQFLLIADTASELMWVNCRHGCGNKCGTHKRLFHADRSSSFRPVPCASEMCKVGLADLFRSPKCPSPSTPCGYEFSYVDGSVALGFFANDTITVNLTNGRKMMLDNMLIGCTESTKGQGFLGADGVLGLGYANYTFATTAAKKFGGKFSYCLVDHLSPKNISNYLVFGGERNHSKHSLVGNVQYTKLLLGVIPPFYAVSVSGISIGGKMLNITPSVWDVNAGGGTIIDSGTSLTLLAEPAYTPVMMALELAVSAYDRLVSDDGPFEYCFDSTKFNESLVPKFAFHFADGARFEPPVKSYIIDVAPQRKCLGFVPASWPGTSIIGNIMQQNHLWEFDLGCHKVGFAPSSCT